MKKLPVLLTLTAASVGIYLALDATGQLDSFRNVPPTPVVASAPEAGMVEEIKAADEPVPETVQAQANAPVAEIGRAHV